MVIAGEPSGDRLAAELITALNRSIRERSAGRHPTDLQPLDRQLAPVFFGAGGPAMAEAGLRLDVDMMGHSVIGITEVFRRFAGIRRLFQNLLSLAVRELPDLIICVDYSGFNRRFAAAVRKHQRRHAGLFFNWRPKIVQFVSPQVWASRPGRARSMQRDLDLLLTIFPFEKAWYEERAPKLNVRFVGHPILDRYENFRPPTPADPTPLIALLPGSRTSELRRHLPPMLDAARIIRDQLKVRFKMVLPSKGLAEQLPRFDLPGWVDWQVGGLPDLLSVATTAMASTGTVTMECAYFGVPTVALYKTNETTYQIGKRIVTVSYMAMPNLLADEPLFPEFIQHAATGQNLAGATLGLLNNPERRAVVQGRLASIIQSLGQPGAPGRAADAVLDLFQSPA